MGGQLGLRGFALRAPLSWAGGCTGQGLRFGEKHVFWLAGKMRRHVQRERLLLPAGVKFTRPIRRSKREEDGLRRKGGREERQDARAQDLRA